MRALIAAGAGLLALAGSDASPAPAAAAHGELAFVRGEAGATEIYVIRENGRGLRRLTSNRFADYSPKWSPDGRRILFVSNRDGDDELYVMDSSGTNMRQLTRNRHQDLTPEWSPDGALIAFASDRARPGEPEIWVMRSDGSGARRLLSTLNHPWQDRQYSPTWSPNGRRLIFTMAATDSNPELYVIGVNGSGLKRLTRTAGSVDRLGDDTMPDWSTDGGTVVFVSNREGRSSDIWTMNPDGSRQRPLLRRNASDDWHPRLAAHGRTIAFTARPLPTGRPSVWLVGVDGSGATRLTTGSEPDWQNG